MSTENPVPERSVLTTVLGVLLTLAGVYVLGSPVVATVLSLVLLGWFALGAGAVLLVVSLFRIRSGGFWSAALGGVALIVLGLFAVRNLPETLLIVTVLAGALFLVTGLARILLARQADAPTGLVILSGIASVVLGVIVLANLPATALSLLGILVGIQIVVEGLTVVATGRFRSPAALSP